MKRILCLALVLVMALSVLASCGGEKTPDVKEESTLKFGLGVHTVVSGTADATEDANGKAKVTVNVAAVAVDEAGKIVSIALDTKDHSVSFTAEGKAVVAESYSSKYELGDAYNMKAYGGAALEWYEQADALKAVVIGKTLDEVKALVAENNRGTDELVNAGCTILVNEIVLAIEKAYNNAKASDAVAADTLKVGMSTKATAADAAEDKNGSAQVEVSVFAAAIDAEGKVSAAETDCVSVKVTFDVAGACTYDATKAIQTKYELKEGYNMKLYGGSALEWYEQADAFDAACLGKTIAEIVALEVEDGKGVESLQTAGCTIVISELVAAAAKLG